ncbi:MAG: tetratricopeptide repeat protein [Rhodospirillales bacterium]|nr:tetratricopeptide repeat protein [Rhodospirillales bacterium]
MNRAEKRRQKKLAQKTAAQKAPGPTPKTLAQLFQQAVQFHQDGQFIEAGALYRQILDINSDLAEVHCNLGSVQNSLGDNVAAEASHRRAIALKPGYADAHGNLGNVLSDLNRWDEAITSYQHALTHNPKNANIHNSLGSALQELDRHGDAIRSFETAIVLNPGFAEAHGNLGISLLETDGPDEAIASYLRALALKPDFAEAHSNMGNALKDLGRLDDAASCYGRALAIRPGYAQARCNLGNVLTYMGQLDEALACYEQALTDKPDHRLAANNYLHTLLYHPDVSNDELFDACRRMAGGPVAISQTHSGTALEAGARLRIGYLSSDFRDHPLGHNILPLIANHDHDAFEIFCYAELSSPDAMTQEFQNHADHWRAIKGMTDAEVANRIHADGVHVLVYLGGQFDENRPSVAAHRPAPVQVSLFAGTTTAVEGVDYWLTDAVLHPPDNAGGTTERFTEELYRLPSLFIYPMPEHSTPVSALPADDNGYVTFASFNKPSKMNDRVLDLWADVLGAVPNARLMLKFRNYLASPTIRQRILSRFEKNGIALERIRLLDEKDSFQDHLARYAQADIALDTFPFSGATTTFQALWMGVPVLSLMGDRFITRMGGSITAQAGVENLTAETAEEFVALAAALADDLDRLRELRSTLRQRIGSSPLCDGAAYARNMEDSFRSMWAAKAGK